MTQAFVLLEQWTKGGAGRKWQIFPSTCGVNLLLSENGLGCVRAVSNLATARFDVLAHEVAESISALAASASAPVAA